MEDFEFYFVRNKSRMYFYEAAATNYPEIYLYYVVLYKTRKFGQQKTIYSKLN